MIKLNEYIKLPKPARQAHMNLDEDCLERGGNSTNHRGVLAQYLNTDIPGSKVLLAHACNNPKCSNPNHLYWATYYENTVEDGKKFGTWKSPWDRMVDKHGYEEACKINGRKSDMSKVGAGNKGKPKSEEHKRKIAESLRQRTAI